MCKTELRPSIDMLTLKNIIKESNESSLQEKKNVKVTLTYYTSCTAVDQLYLLTTDHSYGFSRIYLV